ncbi:MAG: hypothetical protein SGPRY_003361, partial [Prymnesium sp.]
MKRGRHSLALELPADSEEELGAMEQLIAHTSERLHQAGLIPAADSGYAAVYLFTTAFLEEQEDAQAETAEEEAETAEEKAEPDASCVSLPPAHASSAAELSGQWTCPYCGNLNYEGRLVCNLRKCSRRRSDGVRIVNGEAVAAPPPQQELPQSAPPPEGAAPADRSGSWKCEFCGNLNYEGRVVCNMRKCSRRRSDG